MIEADDNRVCGPSVKEGDWLKTPDGWFNVLKVDIHPLVAEEYEMHGITTRPQCIRLQHKICPRDCKHTADACMRRENEEHKMQSTTDSDWWATRTQRDFDAMYEQQAQCAAEPTAEVSAVYRPNAETRAAMQEARAMRRATEDDYFAEYARMRETIAELSRRPTMEQYLAVCESAARITKAFEMAMDTWHQLQAEYDKLSDQVMHSTRLSTMRNSSHEHMASGEGTPQRSGIFPANALRHSV